MVAPVSHLQAKGSHALLPNRSGKRPLHLPYAGVFPHIGPKRYPHQRHRENCGKCRFFQQKLLDLAMRTDKVLDEIEDALVLLDDAECDVLQKRYIECMTFQEIADALHLTPRRVYQLHRKGVEALQCTEPPPGDSV